MTTAAVSLGTVRSGVTVTSSASPPVKRSASLPAASRIVGPVRGGSYSSVTSAVPSAIAEARLSAVFEPDTDTAVTAGPSALPILHREPAGARRAPTPRRAPPTRSPSPSAPQPTPGSLASGAPRPPCAPARRTSHGAGSPPRHPPPSRWSRLTGPRARSPSPRGRPCRGRPRPRCIRSAAWPWPCPDDVGRLAGGPADVEAEGRRAGHPDRFGEGDVDFDRVFNLVGLPGARKGDVVHMVAPRGSRCAPGAPRSRSPGCRRCRAPCSPRWRCPGSRKA